MVSEDHGDEEECNGQITHSSFVFIGDPFVKVL